MPKLNDAGERIYLGVDPGASGGLACLSLEPPEAVGMPETTVDVWEWFAEFAAVALSTEDRIFAVIEKVWGHIGGGDGKGGGASNGSAMFRFGASYGQLLMALTAARIPFEEATPQKWQKGLGIVGRKKEETKTQWKGRLRACAQKLFPSVKVTLAVADALLIAEYNKRSREGRL